MDSHYIKNERAMENVPDTDTFLTYEQLCRQDPLVAIATSRHMTCQYLRHHPMYFLAPLKVETVNTEPWIGVYHDVLTHAEINRIKNLALPKVCFFLLYLLSYLV